MNMWLVGSGDMARAYAAVLSDMGCDFSVIGRGSLSAATFESKTGIPVTQGGLMQALQVTTAPELAIVAVGVRELASVASDLVNAGTRRILLEKPGGLNRHEVQNLSEQAMGAGCEVFIGYNRRFYASTLAAQEMIAADGGVCSMTFEFTEWAHIVGPLPTDASVKQRWALANSSHVTDLAWTLGGMPRDWKCWRAGSLAWHPTGARFCGAGITSRDALFSYLADWGAPGRWSLEVLTSKHRLIFRPLEKLQMVELGSVAITEVAIDDSLDLTYKPGLFLETAAFLQRDTTHLCSIQDHLSSVTVLYSMVGYADELGDPSRDE